MTRLSERRSILLVGLVAALPALLALIQFGVLRTPDTPGYVAYASQILSGTVKSGQALLHEAPAPISLFRMGGYPLLLAALRRLAGSTWPVAVVLLQIAAQAGIASLCYRTGRSLGLRPARAATAALLPACGFAVVVSVCVLTDALYGACVTGAALLLLRPAATPGWRRALSAGLLLALATGLREATPYLAVAFLPLAVVSAGRGVRPRVASAAMLLCLPLLAGIVQIGWNTSRGAGPIMTASRMTVMVQAVLPLLRHHLPVYDGDDAFDRAARDTVGRDGPAGGYGAIDALHLRLFADGMTAPEMSRLAQARYVRAWRRFPGAMLRATASNIRIGFLEMPFQPIATQGALRVYATGQAPGFDDPGLLLRRDGPGAWLWIVPDLACDGIGIALSLAALLGPWLLRRSPLVLRLRAVWCVPVGLAGLYLPVHLEPRYLVPGVPLLCLIALLLPVARRARPAA